MDLSRILAEFRTEEQCLSYLVKIRWSGLPECTNCGSFRVYKRKCSPRFKCGECNQSFSVKVGTIFHASKLPLTKWFLAISVVLSAKKGISSRQLARTIAVNNDTAWYMQSRIRRAMNEDHSLYGLVEVDETYIGGALGNMSKKKKKSRNPYRSGMVHKVPVLGMLERGESGKVSLQILEHPDGLHIKPILKERIDKKSKVVTDGFGGYYGIGQYFKKHIKTNATKNQRNWGRYHINTVEGFFSTIKRAVMGQYHNLSLKHLQSYLDEIAFKKNHKQEYLFDRLLLNACAIC